MGKDVKSTPEYPSNEMFRGAFAMLGLQIAPVVLPRDSGFFDMVSVGA